MKEEQNKSIEVTTTSMKREWLNPTEVYEEFGFSVSTLAKWRMKNKHLKFSKIGKYIKYRRTEVESFIEANSVTIVA